MCASEVKIFDCFPESVPLEGSITGNHLNNLLDLSSDMKYLFESHVMSDIILSIRDKDNMHCHKDVLKFRSKWFYNAVCESDAKSVGVIEIDEDPRVMEAVLYYIYTGDLRLLEAANIYLVEVYEAAEKYGFSRLMRILKKMLQESEYREIKKYTRFQWIVKVEEGSVLDAECPSLSNFTISGNDKWKIKIKCMRSSEDNDCSIVIYLNRQTEDTRTAFYSVNLTVRVNDCNKKCRHFLTDKYDFRENGEYAFNKHVPLTTLMKECDNLLSDGMLTMIFELKFCARIGVEKKFQLTDPYRRYISNEFFHLSEDMFDVFRDGKTHDISFSQCHVKIHNYILLIRSRIPKDFINELEKRAGVGKRLWLSFASFLYTGQSRFLDDHVMTVYSVISELKLVMARRKYSHLLARNLTLENAFSILNDAVSYEDDSLSLAAANFLASTSGIESDPQAWIRIASDKKNSLKFMPQSYIFKHFL